MTATRHAGSRWQSLVQVLCIVFLVGNRLVVEAQSEPDAVDNSNSSGGSSSSNSELPRVAWSLSLNDDSTDSAISTSTTLPTAIRQGNAVVLFHNDTWVAVTTESGTLHLVPVNEPTNTDGNRTQGSLSFAPPLRDGYDMVTCTSASVVVPTIFAGSSSSSSSSSSTTGSSDSNQDADDNSWIVWAVVYSDSTQTLTPVSTVLAVSSSTADLKWSLDVEGSIVGTLVYSRSYHVLYVVHNVPLTADMPTLLTLAVNEVPQSTTGLVTVLQLPLFAQNGGTNDGTATDVQVVATLPTVSTGRPFGPPSLVGTLLLDTSNPRTNTVENTSTDIVLVADATMNSPYGALFVIQGRGGTDYSFIIGSTGIGPSYTPPVMDPNTNYVYVTQSDASVVAWRDGDELALLSGLDATADDQKDASAFWGMPTWTWSVQTNDENPSLCTYTTRTLVLFCNALF
jgi:hypothetical protein